MTPESARQKIVRYCAYQERSHRQVKEKLYGYGLWKSQVDEIIAYLIEEKFLNEERFARTFAGGKFRIKKWGKIKITRGLESHGLSSNCIKLGLSEIDKEDYQKTLKTLLRKKMSEIGTSNPYVLKHQLSQFLIRKGFEPDLVWREINAIMPD
ncbi:MAG: RecX family transcriptional regulator [Flammeovirgaceae bacterium]|nr:RecX family transcriptional regulator [Flammeovirgaceae bacterium]